ncbi:MAG: hypothetical protein IJ978_00435 [Clostridia bacterium]|nr:hypothetical protein [Clostridia bacterium]MBR2918829.1 hypothetical protein [Clostridia bacterium]
MTVKELVQVLDAKVYNLDDEMREVTSGYAGDFLSAVMGKAPTDSAWFTIMNNVNVCAVATLAEAAVVVLCEGVEPDEPLLNKVKMQGVNLIAVKEDIFGAVKKVCHLI